MFNCALKKVFSMGGQSVCLVAQLCLTLCDPHGLQPTRLLCPWEFSRQEYWSVLPQPPPRDLFNSGIERRFPALQAYSLPSEPQGKPKNTGVGCHSLLQGIFLTQESNRSLLHGRQILYQLNYHFHILPCCFKPISGNIINSQ